MTVYRFHSEPMQAAWADAYGHLNEAYYLVPFSNASWKMQDHFGIGTDYFAATGRALYTVETHLRYLDEIRAPAEIDIETLVLGVDAKKLWFAHRMLVGGGLRATAEFLALHFDSRTGSTTEWPAAVRESLADAVTAEPPDWVGRRVSLAKQ